MKKRVMVIFCSAMLMLGMAVPAAAAISPTGQKDTTVTTDKASKAPKTGEGNLALYSLAGALMLGGAAVLSRKRLEKS